MIRYRVHPKFIGKQHCPNSGCITLSDSLSQRVLKQLLEQGNKFILAEEYEKPKAKKRSSRQEDKSE